MKKTITILVIILASLLVLSSLKNGIFQTVLAGALSKVAHVPVKIGSTNIRLLSGAINLRNIRVYNPQGFPEKLMLDAPQVAIDFDPPALFKGQLHFEEVKLNLKELVVVKNKDGKLNVDAVKPTQKDKEEVSKSKSKGKAPQLKIDKLYLTIGKVTFKDYSAGGDPKIQVFDVNIKDRVFTNIDNPASLVSLIMFEALTRTTLSRLTDMDLGAFKDTASGALSGGLGLVGDGASQLEDKAKGILSLFN